MIEGVHIWRAALDAPGWPGPQGLPAPERERAAALLRGGARRRWIASRWALRRVLGRYLEVPAGEIAFEVGEHGKPCLATGDGPRFNLSHSQGLALVAVADREVGTDVEAIRPRRDPIALAERALQPDDRAAVLRADASERPGVFYAAWTRHEARLKCLGTGLSGASPRPSASAQHATSPQPSTWEDRVLAVENLDVAPGYVAAVAVAAPEVGPILCRSLWAG